MVRYGKNLREKIGRVPGVVHLPAIARTYFFHHLFLLSSVDKKGALALRNNPTPSSSFFSVVLQLQKEIYRTD
jgi:hypothetical protein